MEHCHIQSKPIQRSQGYTAVARLAYQTCTSFHDDFRKIDYREYAIHHRGGVVMLPNDAPKEFAQWETFFMSVAFREKRRDAQEGRTLDFCIPRAVPGHLLLAVAAFVVIPFLDLGMAVRVDVECPPASDGESNPHAHCFLTQRRLERDGFGKKEPAWNRFFRRDSGRHFRAIVAGRITLACATLGIAAHVDPRRHDEIGAGKPEERLAPVLWRIYQDGGDVEAIEKLNERRRSHAKVAASKSVHPVAEEGVSIRSAVAFPDNPVRAAAAMKVLNDWVVAAGLQVEKLSSGMHSPVRLGGTSVVFDGETIRMETNSRPQDAALIISLACALEWPALVVDGDIRSADMIIAAAARRGLIAVNRTASAAAIGIISNAHFETFKQQIARHDPLGVVAKMLTDFVPPRTAPPAAIVEERSPAKDNPWIEIARQKQPAVVAEPFTKVVRPPGLSPAEPGIGDVEEAQKFVSQIRDRSPPGRFGEDIRPPSTPRISTARLLQSTRLETQLILNAKRVGASPLARFCATGIKKVWSTFPDSPAPAEDGLERDANPVDDGTELQPVSTGYPL